MVENNRLIGFEHSIALLLLCVLMVCTHSAVGQDLGNIDWKKPVTANGSLNMNWTAFDKGGGSTVHRDPLSYTLSGNLGISFLGWSVPLSFALTSRNVSYTQPFNRIGISPRYKWIRLYGGYTSMSFSPYSLSGHSFLGVGAELSPGPYRFSFMYGRLNRKVEYDTLLRNVPTFSRMGYGVKVGYETEPTAAFVSVFVAKDDKKSLQLPSDTILAAMQNAVVTLSLRQKIFGKFYFEGEIGNTVLTKNQDGEGGSASSSLTSKMISVNGSTTSSTAYNVMLAYRGETASLEAKYERIGAGYETLGAYYSNNNFDNITIGGNISFDEGKVALTGNVGVERSNLVKRETNSDLRVVGSLNLSYAPSEKWNWNASYSNFTSFTKIKPLDDPFYKDELDSLSFYQISHTANASAMHTIMSGDNSHSFMLMGCYQRSGNKLIHRDSSDHSTFINGTLSHSFTAKELGMTFSESFNYFHSRMGKITSSAYGPTLAASKSYAKGKGSTSLSCGYNCTTGGVGSRVLTASLASSFRPGKQPASGAKAKFSFKHRMGASVGLVRRFCSEPARRGYELTAVATYSVSF